MTVALCFILSSQLKVTVLSSLLLLLCSQQKTIEFIYHEYIIDIIVLRANVCSLVSMYAMVVV